LKEIFSYEILLNIVLNVEVCDFATGKVEGNRGPSRNKSWWHNSQLSIKKITKN